MDLDIDFQNRNKILDVLPHIKAAKISKDKLVPHVIGIYLQNIPHNPFDNLSNIDYKEAETRGYFKIDFLNVSVYNGVKNEKHLSELMNQEPLWELLEQPEFSDQLFHLNGHSNILKIMKPKNLEQLAAVLAMIRPAKKNLIGLDWNIVLDNVWTKPDNDDYYWKKSHAFAYAMAIVVQMNLICEQICAENS